MTSLAVRANAQPAIAPAPLQLFVSDPTSLISTTHLPHEQSLARQILHNLQHQHYWSELQVHTHSPVTNAPLPRPLVSGLPPQRLYVHPDEQVELLKKADRERKARAAGEGSGLEVKADPEREWILPTRLNEKWTLRRLAEIFDALSMVPPAPEVAVGQDRPANPWRTTKRVVLGSVDSDSTVVYYIIHDGVVKPRQN
jgi:tRNA-splicing endonuclease subunit Sen15